VHRRRRTRADRLAAPQGFYLLDGQGRVQEDRARLAGHALLWQRNGVTYRMESALTLDQSIGLAESMS